MFLFLLSNFLGEFLIRRVILLSRIPVHEHIPAETAQVSPLIGKYFLIKFILVHLGPLLVHYLLHKFNLGVRLPNLAL